MTGAQAAACARWQAAGVKADQERARAELEAYARSPYRRWSVKAAALAMGVSPRTVNRWRAALAQPTRQETGL